MLKLVFNFHFSRVLALIDSLNGWICFSCTKVGRELLTCASVLCSLVVVSEVNRVGYLCVCVWSMKI